MKMKFKDLKRPTPVNTESPFKYESLFFSITDSKSNITYANKVFRDVNKYSQDELLGQLHKLIRHPDMPRAVFNLFWKYLNEKKPVAAYMKNLAKDGSYYWVLSVVYPYSGGYLSVRLKPGTEIFSKIQTWYTNVLSYEKNQERELKDKKKAMLAGERYFLNILQDEGYSSYDDFMWKALQQEMHNRELFLKDNMSAEKRKTDKRVVPPAYVKIEDILSELVLSLEHLQAIQHSLVNHSEYISQLARSILVLSLNAQIGSSKLNQIDGSLSVIAQKMGEQSVKGEQQLASMKDIIHRLSSLIQNMNFEVLSAKLLIELFIDFLKEIDAASPTNHGFLTDSEAIGILTETFLPSLKKLERNTGDIPIYLNELTAGVKNIGRFLLFLRFIHISGKVEVARMSENSQDFSTTFQDLVQEISTADTHLNELNSVLSSNASGSEKFISYQNSLTYLLDKL